MELRDYFVKEDIKTTIYKDSDDQYPRGYDYIHASDDINQSYEYSGIFFHKNSIKFLKKQKTWRMLQVIKSKELFDKLKKFFYTHSQNEVEKLIILSSGILYSHGIREANDIDCFLSDTKAIKQTDIDEFNKKDYDIFYNHKDQNNERWQNELKNRAKMFGVKNYEELIYNPKYYYYFMGIKFLRLKYDIRVRFRRSRPAQLSDLLVIRQMYNLKYDIKIPEETKMFDRDKQMGVVSPVNKKKYLETMKFYLETRYYIRLTIEQIEKWINRDMTGGGNETIGNFIKYDNELLKKMVYPSESELIEMGYLPNTIIYNSKKPYLYPGEDFNMHAVAKFCKDMDELQKIKPKNKSLRVASYNLHNFITRCNQGIAPIFDNGLNPFQKSRNLNKFIELFKNVNADVICFQELVPIIKDDVIEDISDYNYIRKKFNFDYLNQEMEKIGYKYNIIGSTQHGKFYNNKDKGYHYLANGVFSKIKIENYEILNFKYLNRNIIKCRINYNNKPVDIINVHLEYFSDYNPIIKSNDQLIQQFIDLKDIINKLDNKNVIICGDFNINLFKKSNSIRYKDWEKKTEYLKSTFVNTNRTLIPTNFSQNDQTDHIILHKDSKIKSVFSFVVFTNLSDHYMIFSDFI